MLSGNAQTFKEWQDPEINAINRAPMHANFFAYENAEMAAKAVNAVISMKGGIAAADDSTLIEVPLGYAGIVSLESMDRLAEHIADVRSFMKEHGYEAREEIMSFAVLALPVSPVLKVTDKGLVDVKAHKIIDFRSRI